MKSRWIQDIFKGQYQLYLLESISSLLLLCHYTPHYHVKIWLTRFFPEGEMTLTQLTAIFRQVDFLLPANKLYF